MSNPSIVSSPRCTNVDVRCTNVDVARLAMSGAVRAFMVRVADDYRDPLTREVLTNSLAEATANAFGLVDDDGFTLPAVLYEVAVSVARRRDDGLSR